MRSQIQTNNVNSTELWVELDEQQSSELSGGTLVNAPINILNDSVILDDPDLFDSNENFNILSILSGIF
jgi:hypothetical protein